MVFSSLLFLYYFLPCFLGVYFLAPSRLKNPVLLTASLVFYAWGAPTLLPLIVVLSYVDYYAAKRITRQLPGAQRWYQTAIALNVLTLGYYKYANFFTEQIETALGTSLHWQEVALPIGISFFTFQKISFLIDIKRQRAETPERFSQYLLFVLCFPQLIAGPIVRFETVALQLRRRTHSLSQLTEGLSRFAIGLAKKVLLANPMGSLADSIFALETSSTPSGFAWIGLLAYAMQIYFDFSGYSDMAIGLGRAMGFRFPENFNKPYTAVSITDFWRRWHMTLGIWMKEYLYIPLGGNRRSTLRTYFNLWVVFLLSGLWHGAAWTFVFWGAFHGMFLVLERLFLSALLSRLPLLVSRAWTFLVVLVGWVFFRCETFSQAIEYLTRMGDFSTFFEAHQHHVLAALLTPHEFFVLCICLVISFTPRRGVPQNELDESTTEQSQRFPAPVAAQVRGQLPAKLAGQCRTPALLFAQRVSCALLLLLSGAVLANQSFNPFIYFRF